MWLSLYVDVDLQTPGASLHVRNARQDGRLQGDDLSDTVWDVSGFSGFEAGVPVDTYV